MYADNRRKDGTYNVKIRLTHRRQSLKVSTNMYVAAHQLTRGMKLKDEEVIEEAERIIRSWRSIVGKLGAAADAMTAKEVAQYIKRMEQHGRGFSLDFIEYGRRIAETMKYGTGKTYVSALNALARFVGSDSLDIGSINARFLADFERFIETEPALRGSRNGPLKPTGASKTGGRAVSLYLACVRHIHNRAKAEFNDEDNGLICIPQSPFKKYRVKQPPKPKKRAVSVDIVQQIINLPNDERHDGSIVDFTRRDLARDCFLLSFALAGMNAADLYSCPAQSLDGGVVVYNRQKTASRRADEAEMHIRIEPQIAALVEKYRDPTGARLFCFHKHYASHRTFNSALNIGLRRVDTAIDSPEHITFYAARHSWATIARSSALNIDKYTVHEALNHVDADMRVTDRYIARDWRNIWDANAAVVGLFDWSEVQRRADPDEKGG